MQVYLSSKDDALIIVPETMTTEWLTNLLRGLNLSNTQCFVVTKDPETLSKST